MIRSIALCMSVGLLALSTAGAIAQEFAAYEGPPAVYDGQGGTRETVDGIDFWTNGSPPRKFQLLGYITDRRHKTGLWGAISMGNLKSDIAELAKKVGADAVILVAADAETTGVVGSGNVWTSPNGNNAWGTSNRAVVQKQNSKFAAIRYLPGEPTAPVVGPTLPGATPAPASR